MKTLKLTPVHTSTAVSLYERITNDPLFAGVAYTRALSNACAKTLTQLVNAQILTIQEQSTTVLHILRGGLNFGLRDALADAFNWNFHSAAFISAQRARRSTNPEEWIITEDSYKKVHLRAQNDVVFGDVVATGTSLEHALHELARMSAAEKKKIRSILFFTIGGPRSHEILGAVARDLAAHNPDFRGAAVVYFEGIFEVPTTASPLTIKLDGTDLVRRDALMAPEFITSQYENPCYPLERCTIYDAGSRAFDFEEYIGDVKEYWEQVLGLAKGGVSFTALLTERFPELSAERFPNVNLTSLAEKQIMEIDRLLGH